MLFELHKVIRRKSNIAMAGGLFFSMMIYTCLLMLGTVDLNSEYMRAGLPYIDNDQSFYFVTASFVSRIPDPIFNIFSLLLLFLMIPIFLTFIGSASFYEDYRTYMMNLVVTRTNVIRFLANKQILSILSCFVLIFSSLIFQMIFASLLNRIISSDLIQVYNLSQSELIAWFKASFLISSYYALLISLSGSISFLVSKVKHLSYFLPLLLSFILSFSFRRVPLALAFSESGYKDESQTMLYVSMFTAALIMVFIDIIYYAYTRKRIL